MTLSEFEDADEEEDDDDDDEVPDVVVVHAGSPAGHVKTCPLAVGNDDNAIAAAIAARTKNFIVAVKLVGSAVL